MLQHRGRLMAGHLKKEEEQEKRIQGLERELARAKKENCRLQNERNELVSYLANAPLFAMTIDEHRRVRNVSQSLLQMIGKKQEDVVGMLGGEALRCVHHLDDPQGCGFGPACESCTIRNLVIDTLTGRGGHRRVETRFSMLNDPLGERIFLVTTSLVQNDGIKYAQVFVEDVTEQKQTEKNLHQRERQQKAISQISQMALARVDVQVLLDKAAELLQKTLAVELAKILELQPAGDCFLLKAGRGWRDGLIGNARIGSEKESQAGFTLLSGQPVIVTNLHDEQRFKGPSLLIDHGVVSGISVIIGPTAKPYGVMGVHSTTLREFNQQDIHFVQGMADVVANAEVRKQIEAFLRESEEHYRLLFHQSPLGVVHTDTRGVIKDVNDNYARMIGDTRERLIGMDSLGQVTDPNLAGAIKEAINGKSGRSTGELSSVVPGRKIACNVIAQGILDADGRLLGSMAIFEDITEQKKLQDSLQKSEFLLKQAQSVAGVGSWHLDIVNGVLTWSDQTYAMFGVDRRTPMTLSGFLDRVHPEDRHLVESAWLAALDGAPYDIEHRILAGGTVLWVSDKARIIFDTYKNPLEAVGTVYDISFRKHAEKQLRMLSAAVDQSPVSVVMTDPDGNIEYVNATFSELTGYAAEEVIGQNPRILQGGNIPRETYESLWQAILSGGKWHGELQNRKKNGELYWEDVLIAPIKDESQTVTHFLGIKKDITEHKSAQNLMQVQRDLGTRIGVAESLVDALKLCLESALEVGRFDCGGIYLFNPERNEIDLVVHKNLSDSFVEKAGHYDSGSPQVKLIAQGKPVYQSYTELMSQMDLSPEELAWRSKQSFRSVAVVPILHKKKVLGIINVASRVHDEIFEFDKYAIESIANQAAGRLDKIEVTQALKEKQQNLNTLFESLNDFLFVLDTSGEIIGSNSVVSRRLGYSIEELRTMTVLDVHPPERRQEALATVAQMLEGKTSVCSIPLLCKDGSLIPVETSITLGKWDNKDAIFGISRDISVRLKAEKDKRDSEDRLWAAIEAIDEGFALYDAEDRLCLFNAKYADIYKNSKDALVLGETFENILKFGLQHGQYPEASGREEDWLRQRMSAHRASRNTVEQKLPDGRWLKISEKKTQDGSTVGFRVDITDIKLTGENLKKALMEKEVLLKEIHHRVKNNMQVVSSLLSLQADKSDDPKVIDSFMDTEMRVRSMALVHEILYQSGNLSEVRLREYFGRLVDHMQNVFVSDSSPVEIKLCVEDITLKLDHAVPCGLVIAELITNAFKHAAPPESGLVISITAFQGPDGFIVMTIQDNGNPPESKFDPMQSHTLGLRLVTGIITDQLEGRFQIEQDQGIRWTIEWQE